MCLSKLLKFFPLSGFFRKFERDMETFIKVLQPHPLGIKEQKFTAEEKCKANASIQRAVQNWRRRARREKNSDTLKDYIEI